MFQAVFAWAEAPMGWIEAGDGLAGRDRSAAALPDGWLRSLLVDGVIAGVGGVLVFLPQIVILFFFILVLEDPGYLARAAFLLDRLMGGVGLSARSFIPLLSSLRLRHSRHHGDAHDRRPARPAGHHPGRAADDLLGAAAGLHAADRRLHPAARSLGPRRTAGPGDVRPLRWPASSVRWRWRGCSSGSPRQAGRCGRS